MGIYARYATYYTTFGCSFGDSLLHYGRTDHGDLSDNYPTLPTSPRVFIPSNNYPLVQLQLQTYRPTVPPLQSSRVSGSPLRSYHLIILRLSGKASHSEMVDPTSLTVGIAYPTVRLVGSTI